MASATKIGVKTLHALEGDHYAELPAKPFVRGFVTSYARFVGLDAKEVLTQFGAFIDSKAHDRPNRDAGHSGYAFDRREGEQSRTGLWVVMGMFLVLGGVAAVFVKKPHGGSHHGTPVDKLRAAYSATPVPAASVAAEGSPSPTSSALAVLSASSPVPLFIGPLGSPTPVAGAVEAVASPVAVVPVPVGTPAATPSPTLAVSAAAAPSPTPSSKESAAATADLEEGPNPEDPLNSGLKLKPAEIKYKVVFRAADTAWVRYKVDHKPATQFVFRMGRTLVLRAKESIRFQVSPSKAVNYSYGGSGFKPVLGDQHLLTRQNDATLFFPFEVADSIEEPFPGEKPLSSRSIPAPRPSPSLSPPTL